MILLYFYLLSKRLIVGAKIWLIIGSLFFYSYWKIIYLPLILLSIFINYGIGSSFNSRVKTHKKKILTIGIIFNLSLLGYFKYSDFFLENLNLLFHVNIPLINIVLPLAISFFTFQQIAYLVDSYRGETAEYDFLNYLLFVTFFPQLIAGPIVHHKEMIPQFMSKWNQVKRYKNIVLGVIIFSIGLFKKVLIADSFAIWATQGFDHAENLAFFAAWFTSLSYTFQLYFDFSGYTDMAIGIALMFNIKLPINFNSPYKSLDIQDFWRRWHMTLSKFLRDYVYIPLGGNRESNVFKSYFNLIAVFVLGGLWHGASWMFIIWGLLHGLALVIFNIWKKFGFSLNKPMAWFVTFNFINITWIFFRAENLDSAMKVLKGMFLMSGLVLPNILESKLYFLSSFGVEFGGFVANINGTNYVPIVIFLAIIGVAFLENSNTIYSKFKISLKYLVLLVVIDLILIFKLNDQSVFLYFNF